MRDDHSDLQGFLDDLAASVIAKGDWGKPADYIPELAQVDPAQFAISVALADGVTLSAGMADTPFSIQSVSKVFSLAAVLGRVGDALWLRVGREPSGTSFDSIVLLEREAGRPRNPFINAGALVTTDALLTGRKPDAALAELLGLVRAASEDAEIHVDKRVAASERRTAWRNLALVNYLKSHGNLIEEPDFVLGTYIHHCAIEMTTVQLARAGRILSGLPCAPQLLSPRRARRINALMMTCGHYDGSGDFAFRVGLPGKSGVGGGILITVPGRASVAVWSPGLNRY
ncbi:MAG: glutaminase, partial [Pseudomonadota bacterium]